MNVLQVSLRDRVGRRFDGYDLHHSLRALGHEASMLVLDRRSRDRSVHSYSRLGYLLERGLYAAERATSLQGMLSPFALTFPLRECFRRADVVHWHLVYPHFVGLPWVPFAARLRPTVWTLHDPWALTGHCVHPLDCQRWRTGCGRCPDLRRSFPVWFDTTALVWRVKRAVYGRAPLTLVVASRWMRERVAASPLLSSLPCRVIPFGLDPGPWRAADREACRARLGIPSAAKVVAFRMPGGAKHRQAKGIPWLLEALGRLAPGAATHLLVFDDRGQLAPLRDRYEVVELGWLDDEARVAGAMTAADVFVMPSLAESFGMMALEAMACGVPVIGTAGTAVADLIRPPQAGLAVPARDPAALADALARLLADDDARRAMGAAGRAIVETEHSLDRYVRSHVELYRELAEPRPGGEHAS